MNLITMVPATAKFFEQMESNRWLRLGVQKR